MMIYNKEKQQISTWRRLEPENNHCQDFFVCGSKNLQTSQKHQFTSLVSTGLKQHQQKTQDQHKVGHFDSESEKISLIQNVTFYKNKDDVLWFECFKAAISPNTAANLLTQFNWLNHTLCVCVCVCSSLFFLLGVKRSSVWGERRFDLLPTVWRPDDVRGSTMKQPHWHLGKNQTNKTSRGQNSTFRKIKYNEASLCYVMKFSVILENSVTRLDCDQIDQNHSWSRSRFIVSTLNTSVNEFVFSISRTAWKE